MNFFFLECFDHMYGIGCQQFCGNCKINEQCHHVNGGCLNGCDNGFYGNKCNLGRNIYSQYSVVYCEKILHFVE